MMSWCRFMSFLLSHLHHVMPPRCAGNGDPFYPSLTSSQGGRKGSHSGIFGSHQELQCQLPLNALAACIDGAAVTHHLSSTTLLKKWWCLLYQCATGFTSILSWNHPVESLLVAAARMATGEEDEVLSATLKSLTVQHGPTRRDTDRPTEARCSLTSSCNGLVSAFSTSNIFKTSDLSPSYLVYSGFFFWFLIFFDVFFGHLIPVDPIRIFHVPKAPRGWHLTAPLAGRNDAVHGDLAGSLGAPWMLWDAEGCTTAYWHGPLHSYGLWLWFMEPL